MKKKIMTGKLTVLVIGAGMYVGGRGTDTYGTIFPALNELYREGLIETIYVAATSGQSVRALKKKVHALGRMTKTGITFKGVPMKGRNLHAYKKVVAQYKPDCAIVVVPDHLHYSITKYLLMQGIHTLVVKPLTATVKEAKELVALAQKKKVYGCVEFHKRYDAANLKLQEIYSDGKIGEVSYVAVEYSQRRTIPLKVFKKWVSKTNIFQYLGVHYVDLIHFVTGARPLRAMAIGQKTFLKTKGINAYDAIQSIIEWKSSSGALFTATILTNWIDPQTTSAQSDQKIKVIGTQGRYESDQKNRGVQLVTEKGGIDDINPYFTQSYPLGNSAVKCFKGYGVQSVMQFCIDVLGIKHKVCRPADFSDARPTFEAALVSTAVIEAINKSLKKSSEWVTVTY